MRRSSTSPRRRNCRPATRAVSCSRPSRPRGAVGPAHGPAPAGRARARCGARAMSAAPLVTHRGGCHCGAVAFEVDAPAVLEVFECNCSICAMTGYLHLIVPQEQFRLLHGAESLSTYTFNSGI